MLPSLAEGLRLLQAAWLKVPSSTRCYALCSTWLRARGSAWQWASHNPGLDACGGTWLWELLSNAGLSAFGCTGCCPLRGRGLGAPCDTRGIFHSRWYIALLFELVSIVRHLHEREDHLEQGRQRVNIENAEEVTV